jgi:peptidoglycan/xylan/chitin deacetylase (PgdA/CDA1 family)
MNAMWSEAKARVSHRLATHLSVEPFRLLNETPMVSFTFDDIPKSAATTGAKLLEEHDARGTFYVSGGLVGTTSSDWATVDAQDIVDLHRNGHEIGCHTFSHTRACDLDAEALAAEISQNRRYLRALDPSIKVENFAYPFGYGSFGRKGQLKQTFQSCRSIVPGVNSDTVDLQFLRAMPLIDRHIGRDEIERAFDQAQTYNGWLIFYTHDVADQPSVYGCSPDLMSHALEAAAKRKIPVLNMAEALLCAGV